MEWSRRRTVRLDTTDVMVVPRSALVPADRAHAEALVDDALADIDARRAIAAWLGLAVDDLDGLRERAAALLADGSWRAIELERAWDRPRPEDPWSDPVTPEGPDRPRPDRQTWIAITIVDEDGRGYAGTTWTLTTPDGDDRRVRLDERSTWRADDLPSTGTAHLRFVGHTDPGAALAGFAGPGPDDAWIGDGDGGDVPLTTGRAHTVVVVRGRTEIVLLDDAGRPEIDEWCELTLGDRRQVRRTDAQGAIVLWHPRAMQDVVEVRFVLLARDAVALERSVPLPQEARG